MKYVLEKFHKYTPDELLIEDLRRAVRKLGKDYLTINEYERDGQFSPATMSYRFGGWNKALIKAGLKVTLEKNVTMDDLIRNLKKVWDALGRQPRRTDLVKPLSRFTYQVYSRRFGSWCKALEYFVNNFGNGEFVYTKHKKPRGKINEKKNNRDVSKSLRFDVFRGDNYSCVACGRTPARNPEITLHVDHRIPVSEGGETTLENLQTLCSYCNLGKGAKPMEKPPGTT